jgi:hypothetical protein
MNEEHASRRWASPNQAQVGSTGPPVPLDLREAAAEGVWHAARSSVRGSQPHTIQYGGMTITGTYGQPGAAGLTSDPT